MNRQIPPKSAGPLHSKAKERGKRQKQRSFWGLTPQQGLILVLVAVLGAAALTFAAFRLLSYNPALSGEAGGTSAPRGVILTLQTPNLGNMKDQTRLPGTVQAIPSLSADCATQGSGYSQGTVVQVTDNGTLEVQVAGKLERVGYAGIEVTQTGLPYRSAAQKAREILMGQTVILVKDVSEQDASGRLPRYVFTGGQFINLELVRQGLAAVSPNSPDQACAAVLQQAQQQARAERQGVWKLTPVPTRTFVPLVSLVPVTQAAGCDCFKRPTCSDFETHAAAQACFNACQDYNSKLDDNHDGIACENLP